MNTCSTIYQAITRRKTIDESTLLQTKLKRSLNLVDLVGIDVNIPKLLTHFISLVTYSYTNCEGIGNSLGIGVYVIIGHIVKYDAGPSTVLSVLFAGVAAFLAGLCYAECSTRIPRTGSCYVYAYATLGELCAFVVGWSMILENILGVAATAKAWSQYIDVFFNGSIHRYLDDNLRWTSIPIVSESPDLVAFGIVILCTMVVCLGIKVSAVLSVTLSIFSGLIMICIICIGFFHVKHENWIEPPGFFPHGFTGVLSASATLYYGFIGFDSVALSSEETKEPIKTIPTAIFTSLITCFLLYFGATSAITLACSWNKFSDDVTISKAYDVRGIHGALQVISVGGLIALTAALVTSMYAIPRNLFAMGRDRLIFKCFGTTNYCTNISVSSILLPGIVSAILSSVFKFNILIEVLSIGTIAASTAVVICVVCLRYQPTHIGLYQEYEDPDDKFVQCTEFVYANFMTTPRTNRVNSESQYKKTDVMKHPSTGYCNTSLETRPLRCQIPRGSTYQKMDSVISSTSAGSISSLFQLPPEIIQEPSQTSWLTTSVALVIYLISSVLLSLLTVFGGCYIIEGTWWAISLLVLSVIILTSAMIIIFKQPQNQTKLLFGTPYLPFVPLLALLMNTFMLTSLSTEAWIRFSIWIFLGLLVYFGYGVKNSVEREFDEQEVVLYEINESHSDK